MTERKIHSAVLVLLSVLLIFASSCGTTRQKLSKINKGQIDSVVFNMPQKSAVPAEISAQKFVQDTIIIKDAEGNTILLYGLYDQIGTRYDGMATKPAVGDTITVFGVAGNYKGTAQIKNATLIAYTAAAK